MTLQYSDDEEIDNFVVKNFLFSDFRKTSQLIKKKI